jgi:hypothetical protein
VEYKFQNISAALADLRHPWVYGYKPALNYQEALRHEVARQLRGSKSVLEAAFAADDRAQLKGQPLATQLIVSDDMSVNASYRDPISIQFFLQPIPEGKWENKVTIRSTRWARMYEPGRWVDRVSPTPLLLVVATHDHSTGTDLALKAYEKALQPKKLVMIQGGHYSAYLEQFDVAAKATVDWFIEHL